jgi:RNA-directed DNA polymerase
MGHRFLGYGFYASKDGIKLGTHQKSISKMKARIREITSRNNALGYDLLKHKLKQFITGWVNYFKLADMTNLLKTISISTFFINSIGYLS